jgi:excisionase family DNA binding protein
VRLIGFDGRLRLTQVTARKADLKRAMNHRFDAEPLESDHVDLRLSGREDLNLRPFGPESGPGPSQGEPDSTNPLESLHTDISPQSSDSQLSTGFSKSFGTHLVPGSAATLAHGGARAAGEGQGAQPAAKARQRPNVAATPADLQVLWGGRDRLLKIAQVAEHLGVSNATVYGLCERGELPYVWVVTSMRIRPRDLEEFIASRVTMTETRRPHRRKQPTE